MANTTVATTAPYGTIITAIGKAKITAAILNGTKVNIVHAAVGDGGGAYYMPTEEQTALRNECWRGELAYYKINESNPNMIDAKFIIPGEVGGFTIREAALIDEDGDTIAIWNTPDAQKIPITDGVSFPLTMVAHILVEDASVVKLSINPALDTVTREQMEAEVRKYAAGVGSAIIKIITIPASAWKEAGELTMGRYKFAAEVEDTDATEKLFPSMALEIPSLEVSAKAGLCPTIQTLDGSIRFWARRKPSADMIGTMMLRSENLMADLPGGGSDVATDEEVEDVVDGVFGETGTPIIPGNPGTPSGVEIATDEEVVDMVNGIFG